MIAQLQSLPYPVRRPWPSAGPELLRAILPQSLRKNTDRVKTSFLERLHAVVLLLVLPCTVFWLPLHSDEALGTLTLLDCTLLALWATSLALFFGSHTEHPLLARRCAAVCIFGLLVGCCYAVATVVFGQTVNLNRDLLRFMKIFGFPSIIPLSVCLASRVRRIHAILTGSALVSIVFNAGIALTGYQDQLPLFSRFSDLSGVQSFRPTGAVSNPNDYAYISIAGLAVALASWCSVKTSRKLVRGFCSLAIVAALYGIVTSGSRSAMVGLLCGALYYTMRQNSSIAARVGLAGAVIVFVASGWQLSEVFRERLDTALTQKTEELNFAGRLEAQTIALRSWVSWPLGVGASNMPDATAPYAGNAQWVVSVQGSDSIYVDTLLGAGIAGLAFLLLCLGSCWKLAASSVETSRTGVLRAGILSMLCIGFASVAPATSFVAPFFFVIVGLAALPESPPKEARVL